MLLKHCPNWSRRLAQAAAVLLLCAAAQADEMQLLWQIAPDERDYMKNSNNERGVAFNPATGHVLLVSRSTGQIHILDGTTGADLGTLNLGDGIIGGGTFAMSMIGVADDGAIYVGNLSTSTTAPLYKLYRWASETAEAPTIAFEGDPAGTNDDGTSKNVQRWGDSIDVRGAGASTQVLLGSNAGSVAALLTTANGTEFASKLISNAATSGATGVAFGKDNTFWTKKSGAGLRHVSFNLATGAGAVLRNVAATVVPNSVAPIAVNVASNWLAGVSINTGVDDVRLWDISDTAGIFIVDQENFPADNANGNAVGALDFGGDILVALDTNNGLVAYRIIRSVTKPGYATHPASTTVLQGGTVTLSANVTGTRPISLQWQFNETDIPNATSASLVLNNVAAALAGNYRIVASNSAGVEISSNAVLTVQPVVTSGRLTPLWNLLPGARAYLTADGNTERGIAYNKTTGRVLLVSRTSGANVHVLDGETGADLWTLQAPTDVVTGSNPGGFRLNMIATADDGAVYAANLDIAGATYAIYRWADDSSNSVPTVAWSGAPVASRRWGDTLAARGAGASTQLIASGNNSAASEPDNIVAVFTTTDGLNFQPVPITTPGVNDDSFRLSIAFGSGNTFWGKATTFALQQVQFDLATGAGTLLRAITNTPSSSAPLAVHASSNLLALVAFETPDNVRLYDIGTEGSELTLVDQELLPTDNSNLNGTGSASFGNDRLYVLDTNNGIQAYKLNAGVTAAAATFSNPVRAAGGFAVTLTGTANASYRIEGTSDFSSWSTVQTVTAGANGTVQVTDNSALPYRFYRAVAQ